MDPTAAGAASEAEEKNLAPHRQCTRKRRLWRLARRILAVILVVSAVVVIATWRAVWIGFPSRPARAVTLRLPREEREKEIVARASDLLERYVAASRFSGVVLIAFGAEVRLERSYGMAAGSEARLTFGSLPKQFTGYLIHRLADRGLLQLDQPVEVVVPELRGSAAGTPTLRQLLHMTSGLPGSIDPVTNLRLQLNDEWMSEEAFLRTLRRYRLAFSPGSAFLYSNVGYRLLAVVAMRVTKQDWPTLLREEVFEPAGMKGAGVFGPGRTVPRELVPGHLPYRCWLLAGPPCMKELPHWNYSTLWGAGATHAQARDWIAWGRFLKRLASEEPDFFLRYTMADREDYGSGIESGVVATADGDSVRVYSHSGEDPGYWGDFAWIPTLDATIVWLSNTDYGYTSNYRLGAELRALIAGAQYRVVDK